MKNLYTTDEINILKRYYPEFGVKKCQEFISRSRVSIIQKITSLGLSRKEGWRENQTPIKEILDFQSPWGAYLLGLLWADGSITCETRKNLVSIGLVENDLKDIVPYFNQNWKFTKRKCKSYPASWKPFHIQYICHKQFTHLLCDLDFLDKSEKTPIKVLESIPKQNYHYFFRGWHDGDGHSKNIGKNGTNYSIAGTLEQDWSVLENLFISFEIDYQVIRTVDVKKRKSSKIFIQGERAIRFFMNYIYQGEIFGISRKYKDYLYFLERRNLAKKPCGISKDWRNKKQAYIYTAQPEDNGVRFYLGQFDTEVEAMKAYDEYSYNTLKRDLTWLHFPQDYSADKDYAKYGFTDVRSQYYKTIL